MESVAISIGEREPNAPLGPTAAIHSGPLGSPPEPDSSIQAAGYQHSFLNFAIGLLSVGHLLLTGLSNTVRPSAADGHPIKGPLAWSYAAN